MPKRVLVYGDYMLDVWHHVRPKRISQEAPVIVAMHEECLYSAGGAGNVAVNCAHLGAEVTACGLVGIDSAASKLGIELNSNGINGILNAGNRWVTIEKRRIVSQDGTHLLRIDREVENPVLDNDDLGRLSHEFLTGLQAKPDAVVVSDYGKGTCLPELFAYLEKSSVFIVINGKPEAFFAYPVNSALLVNRHEALAIAQAHYLDPNEGCETSKLAAILLGLRGFEHVVVTDGEQGMFWAQKGRDSGDEGNHGVTHIPAVKVEVADVAGAGDTVCATIAVAGEITFEVLEAAARNAAEVVSKRGTAVVTRG